VPEIRTRIVLSVRILSAFPVFAVALLLLAGAGPDTRPERLARHRNLGKAFYENPTTQIQAVEEFRRALELAAESPRDRLNYGLALLRAGRTEEGVAELEKAQKQAPTLPHSWFNLGIQYKKSGDYERAAAQFERILKLVPGEPVSHYNLGVLHKLAGKPEAAARQFETASRLDPNLAAPHFQLFNLYRQQGRKEDAARRLAAFQLLKKQQEGAPEPEDMEWSYYAEVLEVIDAGTAPASPRAARFASRLLADGFDTATAGLTVLDLDGDGRADLGAWSARGVRLFRGGSSPVEDKTLASVPALSAASGDYNNDGLPDLCILTATEPVLFQNVKGRFERRPAGLPAGRFRRALWLDYDHDYDLDLLLVGDRSVLLRNQGAAGFADRTADIPWVAGAAGDALVFRMVSDSRAADFVVSYQNRPGVIYRDRLGGRYEAVTLAALPAGARLVAAADIDNNGEMELAAEISGRLHWLAHRNGTWSSHATEVSGAAAIADVDNRGWSDLAGANGVARNLGRVRFASPVAAPGLAGGMAWATADFNHDGRIDLATITADGRLLLLANQTPAANQWLGVQLAGIKNLKLATGAEIEVKAGSVYAKKPYDGVPLLFGLGAAKEADTVRITWPNGLIQNEPRQAAGSAYSYKEAQRLSGSCPMIWSWNGRSFEFITDVLGVAPLGASSGDGLYFPVDHDEYIEIRPASLAVRNGRYEIRITEELSEVAYLDQVKLMAFDHREDIELHSTEKFQGPPFPKFRLWGAARRLYPVSARDGDGGDVLDRILTRDHRYPDGFARISSGVAEMHTLELDFGPRAASLARPLLVLDGWVDWADGSTFLGQAQEGRGGLTVPRLEALDGAGVWRTVVEDMGMPAGKPKSIVVELPGNLPAGARRLRIVTNLCVYWDEIFLADGIDPAPRRFEVPVLVSDLRFRGFSRVRIHPQRKQPEMFFYSWPRPASMWNPTPGLYTRYGDVDELLTEADDRYVIMGSGDELRLEFDAAALPPPKPGNRRGFFLKVDGWAKDRDPNTAFSQSVEPLPFHGMSRYPYPPSEAYPDDDERRRYRREYNIRPALRPLRPLRGGGS